MNQRSDFALAQLNIAAMKAPLESPLLAEFAANLDRINQLAEQSPGYIWRLETEEGNATALRPFGDDMLVNLSLWRDIDSLFDYVYLSAHKEIMARRKQWFNAMGSAYSVLWWVNAEQRPSVEQAREKLQHLQQHGPTAQAFTFKQRFDPYGARLPKRGAMLK